jgi:Zn-dependent M28 family amino/carboxypeptidase
VESRESARGAEERAAEKTGEEVVTTTKKQPQSTLGTPRIRCSAFFAISAVVSVSLFAQTSKSRVHVEALASPRLEGRLAGSNGEKLASDYLVSELQKIGAKPLPGQADFRLPFEFTAGTRDGGSSLGLQHDTKNGVESGIVFSAARGGASGPVRALSFSDNGDAEGPVVFAGYGIVVPESQGFSYDSYATLDVKDKIVIVLRYFPEDAEAKTKGILARYADLRYKAMAARQHGAKAIVIVTGPTSPNAGELAPMTFDTAIAGSGIVAVSVTGDVAAKIFAANKPLAAAQKSLDDANPHATGFAIPDMTIKVHAAVEREKRTGDNVVAYLPATTPVTTVVKPWVAIGAHYDHLGHGEAGNTLAGKEDAGKIHLGADDNASGSAAVLEIAATLAKQPRQRHVLLAWWSGEELGLIGSAAFSARPPVPLDAIAAYLNFDMVGRMQENKLTVQATGSSPAWGKIIERANVAAGFDLAVQEDPYQPTDVATFNAAGVPSLSFFTGTHADYHKPSDTADRIDYEDLDRVAAFAAAIVRRIEDTPEAPIFTKVDQQMQQGAGRAGVRLFTGTIPDYSTEVKGLLLSGVVGGGPAEQSGLRKGDVIVEIAGQTIANIYDYTYALDVLKIGQPVKVLYLRDGKQFETMLTPGARK